MKKTVALLLCVICVFMFAGCKKEKEPEVITPVFETVDLKAEMEKGAIPEVKYPLGTSFDMIKVDYKMDSDEDNHDAYEAQQSRSYFISADFVYYYSEKDKKEDGVSSLVCFDTAFGIQVGSEQTKNDVKKAFPSVEFTEKEVKSKELYFTELTFDNASVLTYTTGKYRVDFIFVDDGLMAINLIDTENWTLT